MAQVLATDWDIDPTATSGTDLADILNRWHQAMQSGQSGLTRPAGLTAGGLWVQQTAGGGMNLMWFDGVKDHQISSVSGAGGVNKVGEDNSIAMAIIFGS
jgi:hypothetical protein